MADYRKSITFQAKLDTSEIGPTIETLKKQFSEVAGSVNRMKAQAQTAARFSQGGGQQAAGGMVAPRQEEIQKTKQQLNVFVKEQSQEQEKLYRVIEGQKEKLEKLQNVKKNSIRDSKEELAIEEKRKAARETLIRLEDQYQKRDAVINKSLDLQAGRISGKSDSGSDAYVKEQAQLQEDLSQNIRSQKNKLGMLESKKKDLLKDSKDDKEELTKKDLLKDNKDSKEDLTGRKKDLLKDGKDGKDNKENLTSRKKDVLKDGKEELAIDKEILKTKKSIADLENEYKKREIVIKKEKETWAEDSPEMKAGEKGGGGGGIGGGKPPVGGPPSGGDGGVPKDFARSMNDETDRISQQKMAGISTGLKGLSAVGTVLGTIGATIGGIGALAEKFTGYEIRLEEAKGSAVEGTIGRDISSVAAGRSPFDLAWMPERAEASELSKQKAQRNRWTDAAKGIGSIGAIGLGAATVGAGVVTGAASILGIPFSAGSSTLGLGAAGSMIGIGAAGINAGVSGLANDRNRKGILGGQDYEKLLGAEQAKDTLEIWESLKKQDPKKRAAIERLQQNYMQDLQTQRTMGLSYEEFAGRNGYQEKANKAGFNPDLQRAMSVQMQAAGGSTRGMRDLSVLGLQAQRGFDLTNAGSVLGKISGGAGGAQASEQIFRKLMEESIKAGLDKSEFREEQRRYAEMTSDILAQSGVKTAEDAQKVLQGFSKYLGETPTVRELGGAKSAYEEAQGFSAETGGRGGALQFAAMLKHPSLKSLGATGMAGLMEMKEKDLVPSNPFIIAEAAKADVSPEQLVKDTKDAKLEKQYTELGLDKSKIETLNKYLTERGLDKKDLTSDDLNKMKEEAPEQFKQYIKVQEAPAVRSEYQDVQKRQAVVRGLLRGTEEEKPQPTFFGKTVPGTPGAEFEQKMLGITGRPEDEAVAASGVAAQHMLENFRQFKDVITPATSALDEFIKRLMTIKTVNDLNPNPVDAAQKYFKNQPMNAVDLQVQGGKRSQ